MGQQETWRLPDAFVARMKDMLGDECDAFLASYEKERALGLRVNTLKVPAAEFAEKNQAAFSLRPVSWCREGLYYAQESRPGRHPYHEAGAYYIQEPSAMAVVSLLEPKPGEKVLDLCAAPGGKTTHIASRLEGCGLLVSNEIHPARAKILSQNVERMGIGNAIVTNEDSGSLARFFPDFFDCIVVDAPCSGEGMFRKDEQARNEWSEANVKLCAERQQEILDNAAEMLKPGGRMVYSTCTFSREENEESILGFLDRHEDFEAAEAERPVGFEAFTEGEIPGSYRIWPHKTAGEGHFLALMKKSEDAPETRIKLEAPTRMDKKNKAVMEEFFKDCQWKPDWERVQIKGEKVYLVPELPAKLNGIHFLRNGLYMGDLKKNRFEPSQQLAMTLKASDYAGSVSLSPEDERIGRYLRGETLLLEPGEATREKGWILVCVDQYALGWGKLVNGVLKNKYWSGWRLKG